MFKMEHFAVFQEDLQEWKLSEWYLRQRKAKCVKHRMENISFHDVTNIYTYI